MKFSSSAYSLSLFLSMFFVAPLLRPCPPLLLAYRLLSICCDCVTLTPTISLSLKVSVLRFLSDSFHASTLFGFSAAYGLLLSVLTLVR